MDESRTPPPTILPALDRLRWNDKWQRLGLATGMLMYPFITAANTGGHSSGAAAVAGYVIAALFACCYLVCIVASGRQASNSFWWLMGAMTVLFLVDLPFAQGDAFFLACVVVSMTATRLGRWGLAVVGAGVLGCLLVPPLVPSWHDGPGWLQAATMIFTVLLVFAFAETYDANQALVQARAEVARLASEAERNRIARDLHDLLGHSLTAITIKSSLARRLAGSEPARSLDEISEVEQLSRQALADVRAAVAGYREVTLTGELANGRELLRAAGITADLPKAADIVDTAHQELFGWAVREGLTNVVRHAHASRCTVLLSASEIEVRDDGVGGPASAGNGLTGLRERVAVAGGSVEAGPLSPRGWRLKVTLRPKAASLA
jgi:two-component system sensor histidine kinase DesK